jgi:hypothetical protein
MELAGIVDARVKFLEKVRQCISILKQYLSQTSPFIASTFLRAAGTSDFFQSRAKGTLLSDFLGLVADGQRTIPWH